MASSLSPLRFSFALSLLLALLISPPRCQGISPSSAPAPLPLSPKASPSSPGPAPSSKSHEKHSPPPEGGKASSSSPGPAPKPPAPKSSHGGSLLKPQFLGLFFWAVGSAFFIALA